ncbi:MAG: phage tail protein [Clostridia bacterium]|nr:phage tail protein [Clostridia bacterium]
MIGSFGPVVFETSTKRIRTFDDFKRSGSARWATHELMGRKPLREFLGPGLEQISFTIRLDVSLGVNPAHELTVLRLMRDQGMAFPLILEGRPLIVGSSWVIESMNETWLRVDNRGRLLAVEVELTLSEYPQEVV